MGGVGIRKVGVTLQLVRVGEGGNICKYVSFTLWCALISLGERRIIITSDTKNTLFYTYVCFNPLKGTPKPKSLDTLGKKS